MVAFPRRFSKTVQHVEGSNVRVGSDDLIEAVKQLKGPLKAVAEARLRRLIAFGAPPRRARPHECVASSLMNSSCRFFISCGVRSSLCVAMLQL
jgi:hypothetical protein